MGIKQKFIVLAGIVGIILTIVSVTGYFTAYNNLSEAVNEEIAANINAEREYVDGWLREKAKPVTSQADLMTEVEKSGLEFDHEDMRMLLSVAASDKDIQEMTRGDEEGMFLPFYSPDETGKTDPRKRPWYSQARDAGKTVYTDVYTSKSTGDLVVSAVAPFYGDNKQFRGAICGDITLTVLKDQVQRIKYRDQGIGYIIEKTGKLLATSGKEQPMSEVKDIKGVGEKLDSMFQSGSGYFIYEDAEGVNQLLAYTTVPTTSWIIAMAVPTDFVFAPIQRLRMIYGALIVIGFLLVALSLMSMLWLTQSLKFVEMVTDKGLPVYLFVEMTSLLMPRVFSILSPIALFAAVMFVYNRLIMDSELVVMKAVGISSMFIARAAVLVGVLLALFNIFVLNWGIPAAENKFRDLEFEVKNSFTKMMLREGSFTTFKDTTTVFIEKFIDDSTVLGILVSDNKKTWEKVVTVAERGKLEYTDVGPKILLEKGTRQVMNKRTGQFSSMTFDDYVVDFGDISVAKKKDKGVRERSIPELFAEAANPATSPKDARAFKAEAHRRILAPFFNLIFALLACTGLLVANFNRRGQGKIITISILAMISVQILDMVFTSMARKYEWVAVLMYVNCILPFVIALFLLIKMPTFKRRQKREISYEV